jgi:hypothetical protein
MDGRLQSSSVLTVLERPAPGVRWMWTQRTDIWNIIMWCRGSMQARACLLASDALTCLILA